MSYKKTIKEWNRSPTTLSINTPSNYPLERFLPTDRKMIDVLFN